MNSFTHAHEPCQQFQLRLRVAGGARAQAQALTRSLTYSFTHARIHSLARSLTLSLSHSNVKVPMCGRPVTGTPASVKRFQFHNKRPETLAFQKGPGGSEMKGPSPCWAWCAMWEEGSPLHEKLLGCQCSANKNMWPLWRSSKLVNWYRCQSCRCRCCHGFLCFFLVCVQCLLYRNPESRCR